MFLQPQEVPEGTKSDGAFSGRLYHGSHFSGAISISISISISIVFEDLVTSNRQPKVYPGTTSRLHSFIIDHRSSIIDHRS